MSEYKDSWDPLNTSTEIGSEIISASYKRQISNILKSYVGNYDAFSELIQNSMDSVERQSLSSDKEYQPTIWIKINLKENSFQITDNGTGFNEQEFKTFLAPNISFKNGKLTRGSKGVGATYIAYGFNYLELGTKNSQYRFYGKIENGRNWTEDNNGIVTRPFVEGFINENNDNFKKVYSGATFKIIFSGENIRPKNLSWYGASTAKQWDYLLRTKTPLGSIHYQENDKKTIKYYLEVIDSKSENTYIENVDCEYIYPHKEISASADLNQIRKEQLRLQEDGKDISKLPPKFSKLNGLYEFLPNSKIKALKNLDAEDLLLVEKYKIEAYGYFTYSTSIWDMLNDQTAKLRKGYRFLKGGLLIANNKMIQGDQILIPLTSNTGYQNQSHVIVHLNNADPDLGRKGFQPEIKEVAEKISVALVNRFKQWRKQLKSDSGEKGNIEKELNLHEWIKAQEFHEKTNPLKLENKNFFIPINEISVTSEPRSEQDVIVLFNQLVAGGVIRGIKLLSTSQYNQYDGIYKFHIKEPISNHNFEKYKNPLGVSNLSFTEEVTSKPKVLEYKFNIDGLISEFENGEKSEKDIHLAIAWELGSLWQKNYEITHLLNLENIHLREFHGITHSLSTNTSKFDLIILKDLIQYLNNVDEFQKKYQDEG